jgi:hypothetical protein
MRSEDFKFNLGESLPNWALYLTGLCDNKTYAMQCRTWKDLQKVTWGKALRFSLVCKTTDN